MLCVLYIFDEFELLKTTAGHRNRERKSIYLPLPSAEGKLEGGGGRDDVSVSVACADDFCIYTAADRKC